MFSADPTVNKKRGSVGTLTTPSTSSTIPNTSLFGTQTSTTSAPQTNSLFGTQISSTSAPQTNSLFGTQISSTPAPQTNSLFGNQTSSTPAPQTNSLFGTQTSSTSAPQTNSLFGNQTSSFTLTSSTNSLLQNNNQQQQQQQQEKPYLELERCFPDKNVSYFVVAPDNITRRVVPANFFYGNNTQDISALTNTKDGLNVSEPFSASLGFNERNTNLPNYLTSSDNNNAAINNNKSPSNFTSKKRAFEGEELGRNILAKSSDGIFSKKGNMANGFDKNLAKQENQTPPVESVKDKGLQTSTTQAPFQRNDLHTGNGSFTLFGDKNLLESKQTTVRVFGYDQSNVERTIKHFESLGDLSKPYSYQGNWIIFDYVSPEVALKAIQCNGMNIDQDHLVGVTWDEKAQEVEFLHFQNINQSSDLYKKSNSFMDIFSRDKKHLDRKDQNMMSTIKERLWGW